VGFFPQLFFFFFFFFFVNHKDFMVKSQLNIDGTSFPNENTLVLFVNLLIGIQGLLNSNSGSCF